MIELSDKYLEHFDRAEQLLADAALHPGTAAADSWRDTAQVHATLALAVATHRVQLAIEGSES